MLNSLSGRLAQELGEQEHRPNPRRYRRVSARLTKQAEPPAPEGVAWRGGVDEHIGVEGIHATALSETRADGQPRHPTTLLAGQPASPRRLTFQRASVTRRPAAPLASPGS